MERYLTVYRFIEKVWVVHSKPQLQAQRAIIVSVSRVHDSFTAATTTNA